MGFNDDYVQVNQRIEEFYGKFPEGSIQSEIVELTDSRVTVKSFAYRTPDDPRPGIGHSWMNVPGTTNFTRGSELENTETSAVGRAIAMLGFEVKKSVASAEEVRNKATASEDGEGTSSSRVGLSAKQKAKLAIEYKEAGLTGAQRVTFQADVVGKFNTAQMTNEDLDKVLDALKNKPELVAKVKAEIKGDE